MRFQDNLSYSLSLTNSLTFLHLHLGVTTHSPHDLDFPSTMTNLRSGTWMMTGNGVMHNGTTVIDDYGLNLDKLKEGDRVAVVRKEPGGTLHFFVNSEDQVERERKVEIWGSM